MLFAKHLTGEISLSDEEEDIPLLVDPTVPTVFIEWANINETIYFRQLFVEGSIFTPYEISRQTHLMYALNIMASHLGGFYGRNELATRYLDEYKESLNDKDKLLSIFENTAEYIIKMGIDSRSYWKNKANMFSLFIYFSNNQDKINDDNINVHKQCLEDFEKVTPDDYKLAAKEAVNGRQQRLLRNKYIEDIFKNA